MFGPGTCQDRRLDRDVVAPAAQRRQLGDETLNRVAGLANRPAISPSRSSNATTAGWPERCTAEASFPQPTARSAQRSEAVFTIEPFTSTRPQESSCCRSVDLVGRTRRGLQRDERLPDNALAVVPGTGVVTTIRRRLAAGGQREVVVPVDDLHHDVGLIRPRRTS